ncbi:MAG: 5-formyltetrahydrofolate cyclo-ligase [Halanaerobiales bacterium]|nr:5-formyltetrahydrofolate cyclo-ligase [Halanaerobiales bacterium]
MKDKEKLRKEYMTKRANLKSTIINKNSSIITNKLDSYIHKNNFNNIMIFVSFKNEIYTHELIKKWLNDGEKKIYVPYIESNIDQMKISQIEDFDKDLEKGVYNILEPKEKVKKESNNYDLDIIVVPGLIFSKDGYRIGYGGGYYDKFLSSVSDEVKKVGIVYSDFVVDDLPVDDYDIPVDLIMTERETIIPKR